MLTPIGSNEYTYMFFFVKQFLISMGNGKCMGAGSGEKERAAFQAALIRKHLNSPRKGVKGGYLILTLRSRWK